MTIQHNDTPTHGVFFIEEFGEHLAEVTYTWVGTDKFIIDHTEVSEKLRNKGVGNKLIDAAVNFAREKNVKITPVCAFARALFTKKAEYKDVHA